MGVGDGDGRLVGKARQHGRIGFPERIGPLAVHGDRAEDVAAMDQRRGDDRVDPRIAHETVPFRGVLEAIVGKVVAARLDLAGRETEPGDPGIRLEVHLRKQALVGLDRLVGMAECPPIITVRWLEQVDHRAAGTEQTGRGIHDGVEDLVLVAHRADARRDLAEGPFRVRGAGQRRLGFGQFGDQPGVGDRDRGLAGQGPDERHVFGVEGVGSDGVDLDDPERPAIAGDRRRDHRAEPGPLVEVGVLGTGREQAGEIVPGDDDAVLGERRAGRAVADGDPQVGAFLGAELAPDAVVVRPAQVAGRGVEQVEDGAFPADQPAGELDDLLEDVGRIAHGRDAGRDLAQGLLGVRPSGEGRARAVELATRPVELVDELHVGHGSRRVIGQRAYERDLRRIERLRPGRERAQRAEHLVPGHERGDDHRLDADVGDDPIGRRCVSERAVEAVVGGDDHGALGDRLPEHPGAGLQLHAPDPVAAAGTLDPGVVGEPQPAGRRVHEVDHRPVGVEQARRLFDRGGQQVMDAAGPAIGVQGGILPGGIGSGVGTTRSGRCGHAA